VAFLITPFTVQDPNVTLVRDAEAGSPFRVYEVSHPNERVFTSSRAYAAATNEEAALRILTKRFDPATDVVLHNAPPALTPPVPKGSPPAEHGGTVTTERYRGDEVLATADMQQDGFVVLSDTWSTHWKAWVDDAPVAIHRANLTGMALVVPKGRHSIAFRYRDVPFQRGVWVASIAGILEACLFALFLAMRRRAVV
jgi:hypothetical protein